MPTTDSHGYVAPIGDDPFAPDADLRAFRAALHPRTIIPVPNQAGRDDLAAAHAPTTSKPLYVYRADLDEIQYTRNGTTWRTPGTGPFAHVSRQTTSQTIANSNTAYHALSFDTEIEDSDGMWADSQPTRLTCTRSGLYLATGSVAFSLGTSGRMAMLLSRSGTTVPGSSINMPYYDSYSMTITFPVRLTVGQYLELLVLQNSGADRSTFTGSASILLPSFSLTWQRP